MSITKKEAEEIQLLQDYREVYKREKVLGGIISYEKLVKKQKLEIVLIIKTTELPDELFVNGIRYKEEVD